MSSVIAGEQTYQPLFAQILSKKQLIQKISAFYQAILAIKAWNRGRCLNNHVAGSLQKLGLAGDTGCLTGANFVVPFKRALKFASAKASIIRNYLKETRHEKRNFG